MTVNALIHNSISCSQNKTKARKEERVRSTISVILVTLIVLGLFFYILEVNAIAGSGYKMRELNKEIKELEAENKIMQVNISNLRSINNLEEKAQDFEMVEAETVEYVTLHYRTVAEK
ncbi:MAG: hypothetical protein GF387_00550 [Candidatus Portnoybacteria bacterium]|nr:hypothetical protein [Candidatus Portnoybacteria bacterium]